MPGTESRGERLQVRSNRETMKRNLDFIIMMRTSGVFWKETGPEHIACSVNVAMLALSDPLSPNQNKGSK